MCQYLDELLMPVLPTPSLPRALLPAAFTPHPHIHSVHTSLSAAVPYPGKGKVQLWGTAPQEGAALIPLGTAPQEGVQRLRSLGSRVEESV